MNHRQLSWSLAIISGESSEHHLRFYVNVRTKREDATQVVWRLSLTNGQTQEYKYCWLIEAEVLALAALETDAERFEKAKYYLLQCGKVVRTGKL